MRSTSTLTQDASGPYARYHCEICSRPFDRKDTLSRHMQVHDKRRRPPKTRRKACVLCSRSKLRCDGERGSCSTCRKRSVECKYETTRSTRDSGTTTSSMRHGRDAGDAGHPDDTSDQVPRTSLVGMLSLANDTRGLYRSINRNSITLANPETQHEFQSMSQSFNQNMPSSFFEQPAFMNFDNIDFNSNTDWILDNTNTDDGFPAPDFAGFTAYDETQGRPSRFISAPQTAVPSSPQCMIGKETSPGHAPELADLLSPQPQENGDFEDPWPVDTPRPSQRHIILPALGLEDQNSKIYLRFCSVKSINLTTWQTLRKCLALPFEQTLTQTLGSEHFPSIQKLDTCIDLYFTHFHPMLDIVHQPTFDPGRDPVVTLAMISIGACYTEFEGAGAFSVSLSELIRRLLLFMAEQDRRFVRTGSYLAAQLLQGTHGYCSGSEKLFELSESCRSTLVSQAKCMGLFQHESQKSTAAERSLEEEWHAWIEEESLRRLGWGVYKYDASVAYLHNNRPFLSTGNVNLNMPASVEHWAAESAYAWAALHPWSKGFPSQPRLRPLIRLFFDKTPRPLEKVADPGHRFIIVLTLTRMLWTLKEIRSSPINDLVTPPCYDDGGQTLLNAIDHMSVPTGTLSKWHTCTEIHQVVHQMLLVHMAHIYGAGDLMNWLYPYLRRGTEANNARERMEQWAMESSKRLRDVTYHCAQILGLVRIYPSNMPLEPFVIFHAGVVLFCVATVYTQGTASHHRPPVCLDLLDEGDQAAIQRRENWVDNGGDNPVMLTGVQSLFSPKGRQQVLDQTASLLRRRTVWEMAKNLTKVVLSLGSRELSSDERNAAGSLKILATNLSPSSFMRGS